MRFLTRILTPATVLATLGWAMACAQVDPSARNTGLAAVRVIADEKAVSEETPC